MFLNASPDCVAFWKIGWKSETHSCPISLFYDGLSIQTRGEVFRILEESRVYLLMLSCHAVDLAIRCARRGATLWASFHRAACSAFSDIIGGLLWTLGGSCWKFHSLAAGPRRSREFAARAQEKLSRGGRKL
jgi:hypothetical protein